MMSDFAQLKLCSPRSGKRRLLEKHWLDEVGCLAISGANHLLAAAIFLVAIVCCTLLSAHTCIAREVPYFARNPSGDASNLVFEFNGHIWFQEQGKAARRVTSSNMVETSPVLSPDGEQVAFASSDGTTTEIFKAALATGDVTRLTYDGGFDAKTQGWLDRSKVLYSTTIKSRKRGPLLFHVDTVTLKSSPVPLTEASEGCTSGSNFIFVKNERLIDSINMYRGVMLNRSTAFQQAFLVNLSKSL